MNQWQMERFNLRLVLFDTCIGKLFHLKWILCYFSFYCKPNFSLAILLDGYSMEIYDREWIPLKTKWWKDIN